LGTYSPAALAAQPAALAAGKDAAVLWPVLTSILLAVALVVFAALAFRGRGADFSAAIGELPPFEGSANRVLRILDTQRLAVRQLVRNGGETFQALSERRGQLSSLIRNSNTVFQTTALRNADLANTFRILPTFEREATTTTQRLDRFAHFANPVVTQLRPAAHELSPTLQQLSALAPDLKALFRDLNPVITLSKRSLPALERFTDELHPLLAELDSPLRQLTPALTFIGLIGAALSVALRRGGLLLAVAPALVAMKLSFSNPSGH